jgi:hypothetical protein
MRIFSVGLVVFKVFKHVWHFCVHFIFSLEYLELFMFFNYSCFFPTSLVQIIWSILYRNPLPMAEAVSLKNVTIAKAKALCKIGG